MTHERVFDALVGHFDAFLPFVHTKMTENADENGFKSGTFWKRIVLKTFRF